MDIVWLLIGLALIIFGASWLTDGSSAIARRMGVSDLVIGLTVVAFGTSAPELVISVVSAINDAPGLAVGNVVGSNIFNILAIIGVTAMVRPIKVERSILTNEIPFVLLTSLLLLVMGNGPLLDRESSAAISRVDGIVLLLVFAIFMRYTFSQASKPQPAEAASNTEMESVGASIKPIPLWRAILMVVAGLAGLVFGGDRFVAGASGIASALGVSDAIIGLTIVAAGTSLPELATSVAAALKGRPGIAVGNVIGSCIFNVLMILGIAATVRELPLGTIGNFDLLTLTGASLLFWLFGWIIGTRTIKRSEGAVMAAGYCAYIVTLVLQAIR